MNRPRSATAFTLVELLVVVAIIVALLAILMPSLNRAIGAAHLAVCGSNQRQSAQACMLHLVDHKRRLPIGGKIWSLQLNGATVEHLQLYNDSGTMRPSGYVGALSQYMGTGVRFTNRTEHAADLDDQAKMKPFACPAAGEGLESVRVLEDVDGGWVLPYARSNYGFNEAIFGHHPTILRVLGHYNRVTTPSSIMLLADARKRNDSGITPDWNNFTNNVADSTLLDSWQYAGRGGSPSLFDSKRHNGKMAINFADGHAEVIPMNPDAYDRVNIAKGLQ